MNRLNRKINTLPRSDIVSVKDKIPIYIFCFVATLVGAVFIQNIGVFSGPDIRGAHYESSLALATGQVFKKPYVFGHGKRVMLQGDEKYFLSGIGCGESKQVVSAIESPLKNDRGNECVYLKDKPLSRSKSVEVSANIMYSPLGYVPQAIGLMIGRAIHLEPVYAQTAARIFNLLTYIILVGVAIRILPGRGKWLLVVLGLLPTSLFLASSLSADGLNIAWNTLFVAYIIRLHKQKRSISRAQIALVVILGIGLFMLKVAYAPLLLMILSIGNPVIKTRLKWRIFLTVLLTGMVFYMLWARNLGCVNAIVDMAHNARDMIYAPLQTLVCIFVNIAYSPSTIFYMGSSFYIGITTSVLMMLAFAVHNMKLMKINSLYTLFHAYKLQIWGVFAFLVSMAAVYAALLLTWTNLDDGFGFTSIDGFQGRYILPLLPLLVLVYYLPQQAKKR